MLHAAKPKIRLSFQFVGQDSVKSIDVTGGELFVEIIQQIVSSGEEVKTVQGGNGLIPMNEIDDTRTVFEVLNSAKWNTHFVLDVVNQKRLKLKCRYGRSCGYIAGNVCPFDHSHDN